MHLGTRYRPPFRLATRIALLLALVTASLTLTQCRMVGDRVGGPGADLLRRKNECLATCQEEFMARNQTEDQVHEQNVAACAGDPVCLANEEARYQAAQEASKAARDACMNGCHQQGGGIVGP